MLVNFDRRICYLAHAKTASRATSQVLKERCGFVPVSDHHEGWLPSRKLSHGGIPEGRWHGENSERWYAGFHFAFAYFAVIRNPWDIMASWWIDSKTHISHPRIGPEWFEAFRKLHPKLFPPTDLWPFLDQEPPGPFALLRYENVEVELDCVAQLFRFPRPGELPIIGKTHTRDPDYRTYYDDESRDWIAETFPKAIEAGHYTF